VRLKREIIADVAASESDILSKAVTLLEWSSQKIPELTEMDLSDIIMAKAIADINRLSTSQEKIFVSYKALRPIHAINRDTANDKCNERAAIARKALPLLQSSGYRLSESLIAAEPSLKEFQSINGFQVVPMATQSGQYVTFEGNGRREALKRAFENMPEVDLFVEVRLFQFDDDETAIHMSQQVEMVRKWKDVSDQ